MCRECQATKIDAIWNKAYLLTLGNSAIYPSIKPADLAITPFCITRPDSTSSETCCCPPCPHIVVCYYLANETRGYISGGAFFGMFGAVDRGKGIVERAKIPRILASGNEPA